LPRDNEGFVDLDAYFDPSSTPQKTPNKNGKTFTMKSSLKNTPTKSRTETPLTQRKNANVLLAKPVKMIASKFAERYKKEPRLAVSMSEAIEETRERELELERVRQIEQEEENELKFGQGHENLTVDSHQILTVDSHENLTVDSHQITTINPHKIHDDGDGDGDDRIQRAKRELEEMSINSINSFDSTINYDTNYNSNDDTDVHLSTHIKSTLNRVINNNDDIIDVNNYDYSMPNDEDVLMDRLVEEMLVNDSDLPDPINKDLRSEETEAEAIKETQDSESNKDITAVYKSVNKPTRGRGQQRKPRSVSGGGLTRKPSTYLPGAEFTETGQRRSCRLKMEPLRYWANEKVCYGRADDPSITLPVIVNVIKKPELDDPTFAMGLTRKRRRPVDGNVSKLKAQAFGPDCDVEAEVNCYDRPGEEEFRLVALSHHHVQGDPVKDCSFRIHTIFTEGTYMSSGQLIFPPLSQKPTKNSARHALVFYVITGSFRIEINKESFVIGPGAQFHVPRANHYTITHITEDRSVEGRLFFCHCKDNAE
jgi:mannose-6-phosphate isomerase-like protein (cupin superfamily)